jgi:hypothetical protein
MSNPSPSDAPKTGSSKKSVSTTRNVIGLVVLIAVVVVGWLQYSAKIGYNTAVTALDARARDESKDLLTAKEAEALIGKSPASPGGDVQVKDQTFTKKTYTWRGLLKSYTLTAFYTKQADPRLHHFETEGTPFTPQPRGDEVNPTPAPAAPPAKDASAPAAPVEKK